MVAMYISLVGLLSRRLLNKIQCLSTARKGDIFRLVGLTNCDTKRMQRLKMQLLLDLLDQSSKAANKSMRKRPVSKNNFFIYFTMPESSLPESKGAISVIAVVPLLNCQHSKLFQRHPDSALQLPQHNLIYLPVGLPHENYPWKMRLDALCTCIEQQACLWMVTLIGDVLGPLHFMTHT